MNREETKKAIAVMQAYVDGKQIEAVVDKSRYPFSSLSFQEGCDSPLWDWSSYNYRVKPEPIEFWVTVYDDRIVSTAHMTKARAIDCVKKPDLNNEWAVRKAVLTGDSGIRVLK